MRPPYERIKDIDPTDPPCASSMKYCPICGKEYEVGDNCPQDGAVLIRAQSEAESLIGQVLKGSYRIEEKIGEGGMGVVFRGVQMALQRNVAIKVLLPEMQSTPSMIRRFFQEARLLSQLNHQHVVGIIDFGNTETGTVFMVMEFLEGQTLRDLVERDEGLPLGTVLRLMQQICSAVGAAHDCQLIHRDLKPDNIFIASRQSAPETVKILDFGLARAVTNENNTRLTQTGILVGTAGFVAPEQISGGDADARSDIYALGAILYFMITGSLPFRGTSLHSILTAQLRELPNVSTGALEAFPSLGEIVLKAMSFEPSNRYQKPEDLYEALNQVGSKLDPSLILGASSDFAQAQKTKLSAYRNEEPSSLTSEPSSSAPRRPSVPDTESTSAQTDSGRRMALGGALVGLILIVLAVGFWQWNSQGLTNGRSGPGTLSPADEVWVAEPILVGMSAAFSGPSRELGRAMQLGIQTSFASVNENGGIDGRELELVALDDGYEPARTVANMAELLLERKVLSVLGNVGTPTAEVALPLVLEQGVPFFGAFTGAALLRRDPPDPLVFNFRASYSEETRAIVSHFVEGLGMGPEQIAVFAQEDTFGDEGYQGVVQALEARGHFSEVPRFGYRRNTQSIDSAVEGLLRRKEVTKGVVLVATYRTAAQLVQRLKHETSEITFAGLSFVGSNAFAEELLELGPGIAEGVIVTQVVPHFDSDLPGVVRYRELLAEHYPAEKPGFVSLEGYLAAQIFVQSLRRSGRNLSGDALVTATESLDDLDLQIGADVQFGPDRHQGSHQVWGTVLDRAGVYRPLTLPKKGASKLP